MVRKLLEGVVLPAPIANQVPKDFVAFIVAILQSSSKIDPFEDRAFASRQANPSSTASTTELLIADETGKVHRLTRTSWCAPDFRFVSF